MSTKFSPLLVDGKSFFFRYSRVCNSDANSPIWPEMEFVQDFMLVLIICKFEEDPIKIEGAIVSTTFFRRSRAGNFEVNRRMWPDFGFVRDFISVLVTYKSDDDPIKDEGAIVSTTFSLL